MWAISAVPLGVYVIVQNLNIPLILQPQLFGALSLVSWGQVWNLLVILDGFPQVEFNSRPCVSVSTTEAGARWQNQSHWLL
jgi:hypothetical protein